MAERKILIFFPVKVAFSCFILLVAAVLFAVCQGQEGSYVFLKAQKKKKGTLLRAKCIYKLSKPIPSEVAFEIEFDGETKSFKSKQVAVTDKVGNVYSVRSIVPVKKKFTVPFSLLYTGDTRPTGTCSSLSLPEATTESTTLGTYSPLSYSFGATVLRSWPDNGGTRIEALCTFAVNKKYKPKKKHFIIDFGTKVTKFENWEGKQVESEGDSGVWFHMRNIHWLETPSLEFFFQATYNGNEQPSILCSSDLPEYITTTQAPVTTTEAPVTTTEAPVKTTEAPVTTTEAPVKTTEAPVTTTEAPATTTEAPATSTEKPVETTETGTTFGPLPALQYKFPAKIKSSWNVSEGVRTSAVCVFSVDDTYEPETNYFLIDFGILVQNFENWVGKKIQPTGNSGRKFYMSNLHWIHPQKLEVYFQATYPADKSPIIKCSSNLPPLVKTTQVPITTTKSPTTTSQVQVTTTKSPATTTQVPVTTTQSPTTSNKPPVTTTQAPGTTTTTSRETTQPQDGSFNYNEVIKKSIWFYRAQRSGDLPEVENDPVPWRGDSALYDGKDLGLDLTGGWYDAGDWVKFNLPISSSVAVLGWGLVQWEDAYRTAGQYRTMLDCIKWPLDFFLKCWREDDQVLYGQVGNGGIDHSKMMRPEDMTESNMPRPSYKVTSSRGGSDLAGSMVAAFAVGAMAFKETDKSYSEELLAAAESLYVFADTYRALYTDEISDAGGYYRSSGYKDELVYAAAMLYKATGNEKYLQDAEAKYDQFGFDYKTPWAFDWDDKLIAAKILLFEATGKARYSRDIKNFLKEWGPTGSVQYTDGGLAWRSQWGSLRYTANVAFISLMAADLGIDADKNEAWAEGQIDYMLGDNPRSSSYVVGFGNNPPKQPHHKSSTCQPKPAKCDWGVFSNTGIDNAHVLYGALVGGPDASDNYKDDRTDYIMAEVTCDYNAGFQSAVAGLIHFKNN